MLPALCMFPYKRNAYGSMSYFIVGSGGFSFETLLVYSKEHTTQSYRRQKLCERDRCGLP
jgi:hypothetical protein